MIHPYKKRFLISVYNLPNGYIKREGKKGKKRKDRQDKIGVGRGLKHKHARRILMKAMPFAE